MGRKKKGFFKKLFSGIGNAISNAAKGIGKVVKSIPKKVLDKAKLLPLAPFKRAMKKRLEQKGIQSSNRLEDVVDKFYSNIVRKESGFETVDPVTISMVISAVINWFKKLAEKAKTPEGKAALDAGMQEILNIVNKDTDPNVAKQIIETEANSVVSDVKSGKQKPSSPDTNKMIFAALAIFALLYFGRKIFS